MRVVFIHIEKNIHSSLSSAKGLQRVHWEYSWDTDTQIFLNRFGGRLFQTFLVYHSLYEKKNNTHNLLYIFANAIVINASLSLRFKKGAENLCDAQRWAVVPTLATTGLARIVLIFF